MSRLRNRLACWASAAVVAATATSAEAAQIVRFYNMGEDDLGVEVGETATFTLDSVDFLDDLGGDGFVDLEGFGVYAAGRTEESPLAIEFDGIADFMTASGRFDPRDFGGSFTALSQGWVKPDASGEGFPQIVWAVGNDNGSVGITEDGFWELRSGGSAGNTTTTVPVVFGEWVHLAVLRGGNGATLYMNGAVVQTNDGFWNGTGEFTLGAGVGGVSPFAGVIDEFALSGFGDGTFDAAIDILFPIEVSGVLGDVDQDGDVDIDDYQIWSTNIGFDNELGGGDATTLVRGDVDQNGRINFFDFQIIRNEAAAAGVAVPEPSGLALLALAGVGAAIGLRRKSARRLGLAAVAVAALFGSSGSLRAEVVVADDFWYAQPTKAFGPGGGFTRQAYAGGQNGPAGSWQGDWVSVGDGVITGADIADVEEGPFNPETDQFLGATNNGLSVNWLERAYGFDGLAADQTIFFGVTLRSNNEAALPNSTFFINDPAGENQIGLGLFEGGFRAFLGAEADGDPPVAVPGPGLTEGLDAHRLVGKLEFNAAGDDERLTVWLDPTDVETAVESVVYENDVLTGLDEFAGVLRLDHVASGGVTLWDDVAVGTTWEDAASVEIPRFTLQVDPDSREFRMTNTTGEEQDVIFLEIETADTMSPSRWSSLASQGVEGWQENSPTVNRFTESNYAGALTMADGASFDWGAIFARNKTEDVVATVGTTDGLLNLANVVYETIATALPGDANDDDKVDLADFNILKSNFNTAGGLAEGDFNGDGQIDLADFNILKENFNTEASAVPEPSGWLLAIVAGGVAARWRRRRA